MRGGGRGRGGVLSRPPPCPLRDRAKAPHALSDDVDEHEQTQSKRGRERKS